MCVPSPPPDTLNDRPIPAKQREFMLRHDTHKKALVGGRDSRCEAPVSVALGGAGGSALCVRKPPITPAVAGFKREPSVRVSAAARFPLPGAPTLGGGLPFDSEGRPTPTAATGTGDQPRSLSASQADKHRLSRGILSQAGRAAMG